MRRTVYSRLFSAPFNSAESPKPQGFLTYADSPSPCMWAYTSADGLTNVFFATKREAEAFATKRGYQQVEFV